VIADWPLRWPAEWRRSKNIDTAGFTPCEQAGVPAGVALIKGEMAGIRSQGDGATGGPTGGAWIDSNGWRIRLARLRDPVRSVWVETDPPKANEVVPVERYLVGVADAAAHGGKWVLTLDPALRRAAATAKKDAPGDWGRIAAAVRFFRGHADWEALPARAMLGVLSDFQGDNEFLSHEILNLAARQQVACRLIDKAKFPGVPAGLKAIVYADTQPPPAPVREAVMRFVASGGTLVTGAPWGKVEGPALPESPTIRYTLHQAGAGRIALGKEMDDPYLVAQDAQILMSHRYDPVRLWNGGSLIAYATGDERHGVVHLINYTGQAARDPVSIKVMGQYKQGTLHELDGKAPRPLRGVPQRDGLELHLPPISVYAAVEVS
jgi:hypothetical protein